MVARIGFIISISTQFLSRMAIPLVMFRYFKSYWLMSSMWCRTVVAQSWSRLKRWSFRDNDMFFFGLMNSLTCELLLQGFAEKSRLKKLVRHLIALMTNDSFLKSISTLNNHSLSASQAHCEFVGTSPWFSSGRASMDEHCTVTDLALCQHSSPRTLAL